MGLMLGSGLMCSSVVIVYALDSYQDSSNEIFIMNMVFKNFIYYTLSNFVSTWAADAVPGQIMSAVGGTRFFLILISVLLLTVRVPCRYRFIYTENVFAASGLGIIFW